MRGPFNTREKPYLPEDAVELGFALYAGSIRLNAGEFYSNFTRRAVRGFLERANYGAGLFGCDVGDLIYWEQRMGTWTAVQHAEMSVVMQSLSAMNDRALFEAAWGLPRSDRFDDGPLVDIMKFYDPKLAEI
ncbi:hypothetical protein BF93_16525 [Brachybacterium phenoliresistens]|uniref:Uncharacterized protein n=2 Tax=Brachybacterium phenoliresistens TaxID=396014 RepID=Z9JUS5_9MICO|nr:hypothetical protein BF93_16525 [Brachybacterium phenoliresistens]